MATTPGSMRAATPRRGFPARQMFFLALCRICEPISFTSIFPYIYQMIDSFGIASNENEIAVYAGMVTSAFAFAEFSTGMLWGRISDKVGRKPVLIMGLVGTLISMLVFGFAKSFPVALIARALGGGLNGNIGVIQTTVAELVTEKEHQPKAFAIMPFIWCLGSILGPSLGGLLAEPTRYYPSIFPPGGLLEEYPFLLPNLVASIILVLGIINGILFLEETHEVLKQKRDPGVEFGKKLLVWLRIEKPAEEVKYERSNDYFSGRPETQRLLSSESTHTNYTSAPTTPGVQADPEVINFDKAPPAVTSAFTRPVVGLIISYGILAYHTMGFEQLMPVFLSTPVGDTPHHPIWFAGGLGMTTQTIGFILSMQGAFSMLTQFFVFPPLARYFGTLNLYRFCMTTYIVTYLAVPYLDFLPPSLQLPGIYGILAVKIIYGVLAYPCNAILLTNSAPSLLVLGAINGVAASCASLARAISPTVTGMIYSKGLDMNMVGLAWWVNGCVAVLGGLQCLMLRDSDFPELEEPMLEVEEVEAEHAAVTAQIAIVAPVVSADEVINEYGLVRAAMEGEVGAHAIGSYVSTRSFIRPMSARSNASNLRG